MGIFSKKKPTEVQQADSQAKVEVADKAVKKDVAHKVKPSKTSVESKHVVHQQTVSDYGHRFLVKPMITEKSAHLHAHNQYVFKVPFHANKVSVKKAIKEIYGVEPVSVNIISVAGKKVRRGKSQGSRSDYKKAVISLKKGQTIKVYEGV